MRHSPLLAVILGIACFACGGHSQDLDEVVEVAQTGASVKVRQDACMQIAEVGGDQAVEVLIGFLDDDVLWYCAAHSLGQLRDSRAVEPLLAHAVNGERATKMVWAVGEIRDPRALDKLEALDRSLRPSTEQEKRLKSAIEEAISKIREG
jgi:HEAT repeat protein